MLNTMILVPAYGRMYDTVDQAKVDWKMGKDFMIVGAGCYCSIRNLDDMQADLTTVYIFLPNINKSFHVSTHFD
jgi:hypothetical protein